MGRRWLFAIHVDWRWIKQRPHWFAEVAAAREEDVFVLYRPNPARWSMPRNSSGVMRCALPPLPLSVDPRRPDWLRTLGAKTGEWITRAVSWWRQPTHLYISHPKLFDIVPEKLLDECVVVYDCMDDALAMARSPAERRWLAECERQLVNASAIVAVSSQRLIEILSHRYPERKDRLELIHNAYSPRRNSERKLQFDLPWIREIASDQVVSVGYIGTIGSWIDDDAIRTILSTCNRVTIFMIGPAQVKSVQAKRMRYVGPIEHGDVYDAIQRFDCLMMPFAITSVTESVNPVKLYEYISGNSPILVPKYPEMAQFNDFVYQYETLEELESLIARLCRDELPSRGTRMERDDFLRTHTWDKRWGSVVRQL